MDYEVRRKEPGCISGVDSRTDVKLEAKARNWTRPSRGRDAVEE